MVSLWPASHDVRCVSQINISLLVGLLVAVVVSLAVFVAVYLVYYFMFASNTVSVHFTAVLVTSFMCLRLLPINETACPQVFQLNYRACKLFNIHVRLYATLCFNYFW